MLSRVQLLGPRGLQPARLLCPWNSPGQNAGVGSHSLLQGIFPAQAWSAGLLHCRRILYQLSHRWARGPWSTAVLPGPPQQPPRGWVRGEEEPRTPVPSRAPIQASAHTRCHTRSLVVPGPRRTGGPADHPTHGLEGQDGCGSRETPRQLS